MRCHLGHPVKCVDWALCFRSTYFCFRDSFYEQRDCAAIGSPLSSIVANLYMKAFEKRVHSSSTVTPKLWLRYMDDTFVVWLHSQNTLDDLHSHLNALHSSMQFTREEVSVQFPFWICVWRKETAQLTTTVYRRSTHTNRYLHYTSHLNGRQLLSGMGGANAQVSCV